MKGFLSDGCKVSVLSTTTQGAAGTSAITSSALDMAGYEGVLFVIPVGALVAGAVTSVKVKQDAASGGSYADLVNTNQAIADDADDGCVLIDVLRPQKQFLKVVLSRATQNATIGGIIAIQYHKRNRAAAISHASGVLSEQHNSPAEGTA